MPTVRFRSSHHPMPFPEHLPIFPPEGIEEGTFDAKN